MPLIHTIQINSDTKVGIWKISESEHFFLNEVNVQKTISHPYKKLQHLAGRQLLSILEPEFPTQDIQITPSGKPYLPQESYRFSISHSKNYAAAIISRSCRVGIDVEKITSKSALVAPKFLNSQECGPPSADRPLSWYALCWSAKETVYKWYGKKGVNFKNDIRLAPFSPKKEGAIDCLFQKSQFRKELCLNYRMNEEFVLVWLADQTIPNGNR